MSRSVLMPTTQPAEWVLDFEARASESKMTLSEWVGLACVKESASMRGKETSEVLAVLPDRAKPGRKAKEG